MEWNLVPDLTKPKCMWIGDFLNGWESGRERVGVTCLGCGHVREVCPRKQLGAEINEKWEVQKEGKSDSSSNVRRATQAPVRKTKTRKAVSRDTASSLVG